MNSFCTSLQSFAVTMLRLRPTARGYTMLACCQMIRSRFEDAVMSAQAAHDMAPSNVQNLCVLADTHMACGNTQQSSQKCSENLGRRQK